MSTRNISTEPTVFIHVDCKVDVNPENTFIESIILCFKGLSREEKICCVKVPNYKGLCDFKNLTFSEGENVLKLTVANVQNLFVKYLAKEVTISLLDQSRSKGYVREYNVPLCSTSIEAGRHYRLQFTVRKDSHCSASLTVDK